MACARHSLCHGKKRVRSGHDKSRSVAQRSERREEIWPHQAVPSSSVPMPSREPQVFTSVLTCSHAHGEIHQTTNPWRHISLISHWSRKQPRVRPRPQDFTSSVVRPLSSAPICKPKHAHEEFCIINSRPNSGLRARSSSNTAHHSRPQGIVIFFNFFRCPPSSPTRR